MRRENRADGRVNPSPDIVSSYCCSSSSSSSSSSSGSNSGSRSSNSSSRRSISRVNPNHNPDIHAMHVLGRLSQRARLVAWLYGD